MAHHEGTYLDISQSGGAFLIHPFLVELGLVIGKRGKDIAQDNADSHIAGYSTY